MAGCTVTRRRDQCDVASKQPATKLPLGEDLPAVQTKEDEMTQPSAPSANDFLLGSGAKSASFLTPGTSHIGVITKEPVVVQERDIQTKQPKVWPKTGEPKWQLVVTIQTQERALLKDGSGQLDPQDDGVRAIYASSHKKAAIADAVRASGAKGLQVGGTLEVTYTHDAPLEQGQLQASKLYTARYAPPQFPVDQQSGQQAGQAQPYQPPQQQYQAPVQQQPQFQQPVQQQFPAQQAQQFPPQNQQPQFQQPQAQAQAQAQPTEDPWGQPPVQQGQFPAQQQPQAQQAPPVQQQAPQGQPNVDAASQQALLNILQGQQQQG